jgi:ubiquinone/menaquinone biosynthesis C-methylase UbiE
MSARQDALANARLTGYGRPGFASRYQTVRPRPPGALVDLLLQLAQVDRPDLVVDLGCGTGLSTVLWANRARRVIGIEALDEMRAMAERAHRGAGVEFRAGVAQDTGLPDGVADIVTCAQSLHHMEPDTALTEIHRILRPAGVFAAYDYDWPPIVHPDAEAAFSAFVARSVALLERHGIQSVQQRWRKDEHVERMERRFRYTREAVLHHVEPCTAERWVDFALTLHHVAPVLELGLSDSDLAWTRFARCPRARSGRTACPGT